MRTLILLLSLSAVAAANPRDPRAWPTVARIMVPGGGGSYSLGSGCCVYSQASPPISYVLTASHVIAGARGAPVARFPDGQQYRCSVSYNNRRQDVAVLWFAAARPHYTAIADRVPKAGESVVFVGYGGERPYFLSYTATMRGFVGSGSGWRDTLEAYAPQISQGDSGGPCLLNGKVCAVISAKDSFGNGIGPVVAYKVKATVVTRGFLTSLTDEESKMRNTSVTHEELKEKFHYNPATGQFFNRKTGMIAGCLNSSNGYYRLQIDGKRYAAGRLAWFYMHREWPLHDIDHIDGDKLNNAIFNLRDVTRSVNAKNAYMKRNNTSGATGVSLNKAKVKAGSNAWCANICIEGKQYCLGHFATFEEALAARNGAAIVCGQFTNRHGLPRKQKHG